MQILPELTKEYILANVSQEEIFAKFFTISLESIYDCINYNIHINSAVRNDEHPSMGFTYRNGKLICRDFAGYFHGDCFDAVAWRLGLNANEKRDFGLIKETIAKAFKIHYYSDTTKYSIETVTKQIDTILKSKPNTKIEIVARDWEKRDIKYWKQYELTPEILNHYQVYPIYEAFINDKILYHYKSTDLGYAYYLGQDSNNLQRWKLYFPSRKQYRFFSNSSFPQGAYHVKNAKYGIITKGYKDVICLSHHFADLSINAITTASETTLLTDTQVGYLRSKWQQLYTLSDFDITGIKFAKDMRAKYNTEPLFLTNGILGSVDYGAKDISDYIAKYGLDQTRNLVEYIIENGLKQDIDFIEFHLDLGHKFGRNA